MRRHGRASGGSTKAAAPLSDTVSLIHSFDTAANPNRPVRPSPLASSHIQALPLDLVERLRSFPLFESTPESFLIAVGQHLRPQLHSANDYILTEGDEAKAMYWLVRGAVSVTSRDGESVHAELNPGAFFGEIGVLMDRPRTATIISRTRCLLVVLTKEDFRNILPHFPDVERTIRDEAQERLMILEKKKKETSAPAVDLGSPTQRGSKRLRESFIKGLSLDEEDHKSTGFVTANKKRKSPSPILTDGAMSSALGNGSVNVRLLLKELPLFSGLPSDILHFLGLNAQPRSYPPFTDIIRQNSQGREIYFIVHGEVEVLTDGASQPSQPHGRRQSDGLEHSNFEVKARLREGQYFGEVVSLSLAPRRTATVRSVSAVECLMISGEVLAELWKRCPTDVRQQVERTAKERLQSASDNDVVMGEAPEAHQSIDDKFSARASRRMSMPLLTLTETELDAPPMPSRAEDPTVLQPSDPDPFLNVGLDNVRLRSRRGSVASLSPIEATGEQLRPSPSGTSSLHSISESPSVPNLQKTGRSSQDVNRGTLPDSILVNIFRHLELHHILRLRAVSLHWSSILSNSADLVRDLDLSLYNRKITDNILTKVICPFVGERPRYIDLSNCFHITDEGLTKLANTCGSNVVAWKMKSVWDVTAPAILEMTSRAPNLQEVDLSNCRKVGDTLLARIVGWVHPGPYKPNDASGKALMKPTMQTAAGTVFGCPKLSKLTLSYCKHVTDRSMHHIASHAAPRIEQVDLTRCTTITDQGFQYWGNAQFSRLRKLCLADCTYLTDKAIVYLTNAAKQLEELDLVRSLSSACFQSTNTFQSFCCALSDTATEVLALQCSQLTCLKMSFCGSAISDPSLRSIGLHLLRLKKLSVRGCVRVTGIGVEAVADGCEQLQLFDVSQCKNLIPWLERGGPIKYGNRIHFGTVAESGQTFR